MSPIAIEKASESGPQILPIFTEIANQFEMIERRAFDLFEQHGREFGRDLENWLEAERDMVSSPATELVDKDTEFRARIALPGFTAKDIHVAAMPDAIVVKADAIHRHEKTDANVCFCEFSQKKLFRRLPFPSAVDVDKVSAALDNGVLEVTAPKAVAKKSVPVENKAATAKT